MKITKEKLKELAAEIIAEDAGELKEFFGLFGDSDTVKSLNGLVGAIARDEKIMKQAIEDVKQAVKDYTEPEKHLSAIAGYGGRIKSRMETYVEMAKTVDPKEWAKHREHEKVDAARSESSYVRGITRVNQQDVPEGVRIEAGRIDHTIESYNRSIRAAFKDMDLQSATASKIKYDPRYQDPLVTRLHTGRDPMARHTRESKMKITKANIKKLVAESIGDIFSENATISENADNDRVIEEIATAALGAIMNHGDFELERLIPDAGDRAEFTNKFKSGVIKDLKQFSELPPLDRRLPPLERLDEGNEEMAKVAKTLHQAAKLISDSGLLKTLQTKGMQDGDLKAYDEAFEIFTKLISLRDKVSK